MKRILLKPIISEKSMSKTAEGKYIFVVHPSANKVEITKAIRLAYKVDPKSVNVINVKGRERRWRGRVGGKTKDWRKAIVSLKKGQKIEGFEVK